MTKKRYYAHKHLLKENEVHDKRCHNFMSLDETVEHLNNEYWKYKQLKNENKQLKQDLEEYCNFSLHDVLDKKNKKIERLQSTLAYRSNQLALMEQLIDDLGHEEMKRQMEEILND